MKKRFHLDLYNQIRELISQGLLTPHISKQKLNEKLELEIESFCLSYENLFKDKLIAAKDETEPYNKFDPILINLHRAFYSSFFCVRTKSLINILSQYGGREIKVK